MEQYYHKNTYHHLYNRGANKQTIFFDENDYLYFLKRLKYYKEKYHISVLCYCLLPNHFHLFLKQLSEKYTLGRMIGDLTNSYTKTINKKYKRSGVVFEGPTKARHVKEEPYFIWLFKYILLNPVRAKFVVNPKDWEFSAVQDYLGLRNGGITDQREIMSLFGSKKELKEFLYDTEDLEEYSNIDIK